MNHTARSPHRVLRGFPVVGALGSLWLVLTAWSAGPAAAQEPAQDPSPPEAVEPADLGGSEPEEELVPLLDPTATPVPETPNVDFDLEVARRKLEMDFGTQPDALEVDEVFDVTPLDVLDDSVRRVPLRGEREVGLDLRSVERFHWQCRGELGRRGVTLFGNGTVRLKTGSLVEPEMFLDELTPELTVDYMNRVASVVRTQRFKAEVASAAAAQGPLPRQAREGGYRAFGTLEGRWLEACLLRLQLPDSKPLELWLPKLEVPTLEVSQLVAIADELAKFTRPLQASRGLGSDYVPTPGDLLRREDDQLFRVVGVTIDGSGIELESLSEPIRIYYLLEDLPRLFVGREGNEAGSASSTEGREPEIRELTLRPGGG